MSEVAPRVPRVWVMPTTPVAACAGFVPAQAPRCEYSTAWLELFSVWGYYKKKKHPAVTLSGAGGTCMSRGSPGPVRPGCQARPLRWRWRVSGGSSRMPAPAFYRTPASQTSPLSLAFRSRSGRCLSNSPRRSRNQVYIIHPRCCHVACSSHPYHVAVKVGSRVTF